MNSDNRKTPQQMTSAELQQAIRDHREQVRRLLAEARARRAINDEESEARKTSED